MKKHIPNLLTCLNLAIGCVGIYYTLGGKEPIAFYFVIVAGLFDFLDGFSARLLKVQSEIGKQLDSLSDLVSFGLLPSFFMLKWLEGITAFYWVAIIIAVFSAIRLAVFNVDESQTDSFKGLPTPANAIMLTSLSFVSFELYEYTLISICLFSALLLVSPIRLVALKFKSFAWKGNEGRWILIAGIVVFISVFQWTFIPFLIPFYLVVSLISFVAFKKG
ncbi:CDP-diacylglycerol---serine O-phosphatidyltransferase [Ekhidna lutea]|uniref:CDP-diacylglycerol---serine O-phosphatidyltransferase n=1 Tax=Ekhidna lutea TaxID=447679 RepID=A0A239IQK4_EKHLU|nr:CDP-alcohol phosphatidyltransferase family protein [Ekhidna lutea]SNS96056.1 CDP-diacylglycerol---serine O-phosphatidyltransferase [Ekhidna lutea]